MSTPTTTRDDTLAKFDRDGYAIFRNVLDADLMAEAAAHIDWVQARNPDVRPEHLGQWLVKEDPFWVRLVSDDRLLDIAELFVGPDLALFASHYISKPPFDGQAVLWHQDAAYWPLEPMEVVSIWLAVDEATTENGCLRVIPGSHTLPAHEFRIRQDTDNVFQSETTAEFDESTAVDIELKPGDCEVHHPNILHSSKPNNSPKRRCGLTIRYIPTSTKILTDDGGPFVSALHFRGDPGVNEYQPKPAYVEGEHFPFKGADAWR
ncbi:MAG TPA: phytanoyl-CoA dioxygenase family protein [Acidimicrobiales bacterium]|nr:phytanoyl-CoA dioxygenase family protein [Acidimicrobiales bacterium]